MNRLLIVEDDADLKEGLEFSFRADGYITTAVSLASDAILQVEQNNFDGIILDCNLPDGNGFDFVSAIHARFDIPVLMLTARDSEVDEVKALELGIDDYMTKPFSLAVLKARIKRILKNKNSVIINSNGYSLDMGRCRVFKGDEEIDLSSIEFKLISLLMENKDHVLSKERILEHIWDSKGEYVDDNIVSVNIRRLRMKLEEDASNPKYIKTVHGIGYVWKEV
ncbi:MAG: response regulator transcription factor [Lachnospiraceae bacterium]|nr:response regulator transcription factor [Lachnospiraceae bacterium]